MSILPANWLPDCRMDAIVLHWTAGGWKASELDKEHYHFVIEDDGKLVLCDHSILDNVNTADKDYAAHTRNFNSHVIGVSLCGMANAVERPFDAGHFPITRVQWDKAMQVLAEIAKKYKIKVDDKHILSHAEVQANLGIMQRGKWDIAMLPFAPEFNTARKVGDHMREAVRLILAPATEPGGVMPDRDGVTGEGANASIRKSDAHIVVDGDTLTSVAAQHGVTVEALRNANKESLSGNLIHPGDQLLIPKGNA